MNEQAQQVLADMMQLALDGVDEAVEFSKAEIPAVIEQLLMWHMVESFVFFVIGLVVMTVPVFGGLAIKKYWQKIYREDLEPFVLGFGGPALFVAGLVGFMSVIHNLDWLKIWIAPKLYLLEYGASLVK